MSTFDQVKKIVKEQLGVEEEEIQMSSTFVDDLGADSLDIVELIMAFEEEFNIEIPDEKAEKIKDYPIITLQEATTRLCNGNYQTSVPLAFPGEESIGKVELVYRTGRLEELYLPYYRFYVLLPESFNTNASDSGLKTYGIYYVPALAEEYIVNMPTYDGSFN